MDVTLPKRDLIRLLSRASGISDRKSTMPILAHALLRADTSGLVGCMATDLMLSVSSTLPAIVLKPGSIALPARDVLERVKVMPDTGIVLRTLENHTLLIGAEGSRREFRLRGLPGEDYPQLAQAAADAPSIALSASVLSSLLSKIAFAISPDDTRPHINSALWEGRGEVLRMIATDGHRLAKAEHVVAGANYNFTLLVSQKGVGEIRRLCDEIIAEKSADDSVQLVITPSHAFFRRVDSTLGIKLIDVQFPPYNQVIPSSSAHSIRLPKSSFIESIRAVAIAVSDKAGTIRLRLEPNRISIRSENPESGDAADEIPVDYSGPDIAIGFNAKYLLDALTAVDEDEIQLGISGQLDPVVVEGATDRSVLGIVMPMRI